MNCPYCNKKASFITSKKFYGKDYGSNMYICRPCDAYVGTHGNTTRALGTMAKYELRELRKKAHAAFDPLWRDKIMTRTEAYTWMQETMKLEKKDAHIGLFDEEQCQRLVIASLWYVQELNRARDDWRDEDGIDY